MDDTRPPEDERELDDTVEIPVITDTDADADVGPRCGTREAITHLWVSYTIDGLLHVNRGRYCCAGHIPERMAMLPDIGELRQIVMLDGWVMTVVNADGQVDIYVNAEDESVTDPCWPDESATVHVGAAFSPPLP